MHETSSSAESTNKLFEAIRKLEAYSLHQMKSLNASSVSKTISLVRAILKSHFDSGLKKNTRQGNVSSLQEVITAVEYINRNRFFIEKLKEGTLAEQELAKKIAQTIEIYNESCDRHVKKHPSNRERIANFFFKNKQVQELPKITLPKKVTFQQHYPEQRLPKTLQELVSPQQDTIPLSKQSKELFHMKAIALLERYGIASNLEARTRVKQSPIHTTIEEDPSLCTLTQTLSLFPGQTIVVMGTSALDPITQAISQLFPDTFCLSLESDQTGFPHPLQRAGWTVASQILPEFPQRIDLLKETADLFLRKHQAVSALAPQGAFLKHAKELLALKKQCFDLHAKELLDLHESLTFVILEKSKADPSTKDNAKRFFEFLSQHPQPFDYLADTSHLIREYFMTKPHQQLLQAIIKGKSTLLGHHNQTVRYAAAKAFLDNALHTTQQEILFKKSEAKLPHEQMRWNYIKCMGTIFGKAFKNIFLQYLSEDLVFSPPILNSFECQVQTAGYRHLKDFLEELSTPLSENPSVNQDWMYQLFKRFISSDISLFQKEDQPEISYELAEYFQKRYISLSDI